MLERGSISKIKKERVRKEEGALTAVNKPLKETTVSDYTADFIYKSTWFLYMQCNRFLNCIYHNITKKIRAEWPAKCQSSNKGAPPPARARGTHKEGANKAATARTLLRRTIIRVDRPPPPLRARPQFSWRTRSVWLANDRFRREYSQRVRPRYSSRPASQSTPFVRTHSTRRPSHFCAPSKKTTARASSRLWPGSKQARQSQLRTRQAHSPYASRRSRETASRKRRCTSRKSLWKFTKSPKMHKTTHSLFDYIYNYIACLLYLFVLVNINDHFRIAYI